MKLYLQESQWGTECTGEIRQSTLTLLSLLQGGGNADVQRAEPVAGLGFILLQWCYNPATPSIDSDSLLSGLKTAIGVQLIGWSRSVVWL